MNKLTPLSFVEVLDQGKRDMDGSKVREKTYFVKILKELRKIYLINKEHFGLFFDGVTLDALQEIKYQVRDEEFDCLCIKYSTALPTLSGLINRPLTNPIFKSFLEEETKVNWKRGCGIIFPVSHGGDWIWHNLGAPLGSTKGHAKIIIRSNDSEAEDLVCEPLSQFIAERQRRKDTEEDV